MNTIVRSTHGYVDEYQTVKATVMVLKNRPGYITITQIMSVINAQLDNPAEHLTRKMIVQSVAKIVKPAIDKRRKA